MSIAHRWTNPFDVFQCWLQYDNAHFLFDVLNVFLLPCLRAKLEEKRKKEEEKRMKEEEKRLKEEKDVS